MTEEVKYNPDKAHYIVATAIVVKDGKYLLTKRSEKEKAFPGRWTVPGGTLEQSDYEREKDSKYQWYNVLENLVRREVKEETNVDIKNIGYITSLTFIRPDGVPTVVISFYADYASGEVQMLTEDEIDFAWVTLEEAKNYDLIEGIYEEIEMLDRKLKGEKIGEWKATR